MDVERSAPTLYQVWQAMHCQDCLSVVAIVMQHFQDAQVRVTHDRCCPVIPDATHRVYYCPLPESFHFTFRPPSTEEDS